MNDTNYMNGLEFLIRKARKDFAAYVALFNPPGGPFIFSKVHRYIARIVQDVADGKRGKRQAVSLPPQVGKSTLLTIEAVSWIMGRFPGKQIAITGFSHDLVTGFSKKIKERIAHSLYQQLFPNTTVRDGFDRSDMWALSNGSALVAKSVGKRLTGLRVDWLIVDDPHAGREAAESQVQRGKVQTWYDADCRSRLSPEAVVFLVQTRWHPQDLVGYLTSEEKTEELKNAGVAKEIFEVTNLPAICEDEANDPLGRKVGEALFPELRGLDFLNSIRADMPAYEWQSQYQGQPQTSLSGNMDRRNLQFITREELPEGLEFVRGWDLAITEKTTSDYSVGCLVAYDAPQDRLFIVDMFRAKLVWSKLRHVVEEIALRDRREYGLQRIGIEAVAGFLAVLQEMHCRLEGEIKVEKRNPPRGGKLLRAQPWLNKIEARRAFLVRGAWNKDFIAELEAFPTGTHNDIPDSVSVAYEMFTGRNRNGGVPPARQRPSSYPRPHGMPRRRSDGPGRSGFGF